MNAKLDRVSKLWRPLYLRGMWLDGQYRLPEPSRGSNPAVPRQRMLLAALAGLRHAFSCRPGARR